MSYKKSRGFQSQDRPHHPKTPFPFFAFLLRSNGIKLNQIASLGTGDVPVQQQDEGAGAAGGRGRGWKRWRR
jgi:hypothetical protein